MSDEPSLPPVLGLGPAPKYNPDAIVKQDFMVVGRRRIYQSDVEEVSFDVPEVDAPGYVRARLREFEKELSDALMAFFAVSPPVWRWRTEPEIESQRDFSSDSFLTQAYARGFFDVNVRLRDLKTLIVEL